MESQIFNCNFIRKLRSLAAKTAGLKTRKNIKMFQKNGKYKSTVFDISYYKTFKKYLKFLGQYPNQSRWNKEFNTNMMICSLISFLIPGLSRVYISIVEKNLNALMEIIPIVFATISCAIKLLNHRVNKKNFDKLFDLMSEEWEMKNDRNQACILDEFTKQGNKFAEIYKNVLLSALLLFLLLPLFPSFLDIVFPLNETRQQLQIFKMKYFVNEDEYFYPIYFHSVWGSFVIIMITVTIDSLYILIIHHASGLFAMCGYQIAKATECNNIDINENELFRQCVITHNKAYKFFEIMNKSSRNSYFLQLLLTIIGISITAVQIVMYLHKPEEAFRISLFLIAAQFHLFIITLTGQVIADQSSNLANNIYCTTWYRMPPNIQKIFHMIQIKSSKPCKLTAGGILELNIENFGIALKTCMSYFTIFLSLQD